MKKDNNKKNNKNKKNKKNKKRERKRNNRKKKATRNAFIISYCLIIGSYSGFGKSHVNTRCPTMQATC
jgi:F0F1-type ATP synthase assembly protein I